MEFPSWLIQAASRDLELTPPAHPVLSPPSQFGFPRSAGPRPPFIQAIGDELTHWAFADFFQGVREVKDHAIEVFTTTNLRTIQEASRDIQDAQLLAWEIRPHPADARARTSWQAIGRFAIDTHASINRAHLDALKTFYQTIYEAESEAIESFSEKVCQYEFDAYDLIEQESQQAIVELSELLTQAVSDITQGFKSKVDEAKKVFVATVQAVMARILDCGSSVPHPPQRKAPKDK